MDNSDNIINQGEVLQTDSQIEKPNDLEANKENLVPEGIFKTQYSLKSFIGPKNNLEKIRDDYDDADTQASDDFIKFMINTYNDLGSILPRPPAPPRMPRDSNDVLDKEHIEKLATEIGSQIRRLYGQTQLRRQMSRESADKDQFNTRDVSYACLDFLRGMHPDKFPTNVFLPPSIQGESRPESPETDTSPTPLPPRTPDKAHNRKRKPSDEMLLKAPSKKKFKCYLQGKCAACKTPVHLVT